MKPTFAPERLTPKLLVTGYACLVTILLLSCRQKTAVRHDIGVLTDFDNMVADTVFQGRNASDKQLSGTQLFVNLLPGYDIDRRHSSISGGEAMIQCHYSPGFDFRMYRDSVMVFMEKQVLNDCSRFYFYEPFYLGPYPALIYYYPTTDPDKDGISLFFGDRYFSAEADAIFYAHDSIVQAEIFTMLLSMYRDEDVPEDITNALPFTLDVSNSEFAYYNRMRNGYIYTIGGTHDGSKTGPEDYFVVFSAEKPGSMSVRDYLEYFIASNWRGAPVMFGNHTCSQIKEGNPGAWETSGNVTLIGAPGKFYAAAVGSEGQVVVMVSFLFQDTDKRLREVREIAASLKPKDAWLFHVQIP